MPSILRFLLGVLFSLLLVPAVMQARSYIFPDSLSHASDSTQKLPIDSLHRQLAIDTAQVRIASDSSLQATSKPDTAVVDSFGRMSTPSLVGTLDRRLGRNRYWTQSDLHWIDFRYLGGIVEGEPGVFIRDQNSAGQYNQLNVRGVDWRGIGMLMDGRPMNDPATGIYNPFHFSTEYADRIEFITGPRAFIYGLNSQGGAVNLVTKNYNSNRPFTKINYTETGYNYAYSDGTFSQNISHKVNLTFGFQHQGTDGKLTNSAHDAWNGRLKVRYNVSRDFNVIISEYHTATHTRMNGGTIDGSIESLSPTGVVVKYPGAYEKLTRNDVDLSLVGTMLADTTSVSMLTFYYSHALREYRDEGNLLSDAPTSVMSDHTTSWMGARLTQNYETGFQRLDVGGSLEIRQVEGSPNVGRRRNVLAALWGKEEIRFGDFFSVAGFARLDQYRKKSYAGTGADARLILLPSFALFGGLSHSQRVPTYEELYWTDSSITQQAQSLVAEKHFLIETGAELTLPDSSFIRVAYFRREVNDPIQIIPASAGASTYRFANIDRTVSHGIEARAGMHFWHLYVDGAGTYMLQTTGGIATRMFPKLWAMGGIYYWEKLLDDKLELKIGLRGRYQSSYDGATFNPENLLYTPASGTQLGMASAGDFIIAAHIGNAYIHLLWENVTSVAYFSSPYFPVLERSMKLGISWEFMN